MRKHLLAVLAYVLATFGTQAVSHFSLNAQHYASVAYLRKEPIFALGVLVMFIQGSILAQLYTQTVGSARSIAGALKFAWLAGAFLVSYIALGEAAKYSVPVVVPWIAVETVAGIVQFTIYGVLLGLVYRDRESG
jgi:hypothetical protein